MSLATTCPQCKTSFKVVPDQLKLRRGLVRCGMCRHVFSGVDFLRYLEEPAHEARVPRSLLAQQSDQGRDAVAQPTAVQVAAREADRSGAGLAPPDSAESPTVHEPAIDLDFGTDREPEEDRMSAEVPEPERLTQIGAEPRDVVAADTQADALPPTLAAEPARIAADAATPEPRIGRPGRESLQETISGDDAGDDAVDFFATGRRARGFSTRATVFAAIASFLLAVVLPIQLTIGARDWLASQLPVLEPALAGLLAPLGLKIMPPRELDALTIESFELQSAGARSMLALNALLRNSADRTLRWPAMELTLTDGAGATVVRKVLLPDDYLGPAQRELAGIAAKAEWPVRVALRAEGIDATGYSVKLFYH